MRFRWRVQKRLVGCFLVLAAIPQAACNQNAAIVDGIEEGRLLVHAGPAPVTPDDARQSGLESLRVAVAREGVPLPQHLDRYVRDRRAAVQLGKALFWDMQIGSDGVQACASCHFAAGADPRERNQLNPGLVRVRHERDGDVIGFSRAGAAADTEFDSGGPNYRLTRDDYPFVRRPNQLIDRDGVLTPVDGNSNDIASSQGVHHTRFDSIVYGGSRDVGYGMPDSVFHVGHANVRRVEPRNTPTVINAVFNFTNFWDGRANPIFNGDSPFGQQDPSAGIFVRRGARLLEERVTLDNASLASQATGPVLNVFESSFGDGGPNFRSWPEVGRKILSLRPLATQRVARTDSVLAPLVSASGRGLIISYKRLIQRAFRPELWDSTQMVMQPCHDGEHAFFHMEANMAFFFGVAVMLYEATLVSDQTPFDDWMEGEGTAVAGFGHQEMRGLDVFLNEGRCVNCHGGPEFTNASVRNARNQLIEPMRMAEGEAIYDNGFYNVAVTPTTDDIGRGGRDPFGNALAFRGRHSLTVSGWSPFRSRFSASDSESRTRRVK